nr:hypothetical protein [uncultured Prevotella sp.]
MAVNLKHCSVKPDTKPCWVCLHGALCIGGLYCMKHKRYVQYQDVAECEDKEIA